MRAVRVEKLGHVVVEMDLSKDLQTAGRLAVEGLVVALVQWVRVM